ncbi:uncharacterized protein [Amphiura filiformis]|uniref:uncharacterized protein n=1 Tax=Amphiura filiformis TaxID=82378 RepID=UPI003B2194E9
MEGTVVDFSYFMASLEVLEQKVTRAKKMQDTLRVQVLMFENQIAKMRTLLRVMMLTRRRTSSADELGVCKPYLVHNIGWSVNNNPVTCPESTLFENASTDKEHVTRERLKMKSTMSKSDLEPVATTGVYSSPRGSLIYVEKVYGND